MWPLAAAAATAAAVAAVAVDRGTLTAFCGASLPVLTQQINPEMLQNLQKLPLAGDAPRLERLPLPLAPHAQRVINECDAPLWRLARNDQVLQKERVGAGGYVVVLDCKVLGQEFVQPVVCRRSR